LIFFWDCSSKISLIFEIYHALRKDVEQLISENPLSLPQHVNRSPLSEWVILLRKAQLQVPPSSDLILDNKLSPIVEECAKMLPPHSAILLVCEVSHATIVGLFRLPIQMIFDPFVPEHDTVRSTTNLSGHNEINCVFYEIQKFCEMLLQGNPNMLELLLSENILYATDDWNFLQQNKSVFLTLPTVERCIAHAKFYTKNKRKNLSQNTGELILNWCLEKMQHNCDSTQIFVADKILVLEKHKNLFTDQSQEATTHFVDAWLLSVRKKSN